MASIVTSHCRDNYYREFAHKTIEGVDFPYYDGHLPELRRIKRPVTDTKVLEHYIKRSSNRPGQYITVYSFSHLWTDKNEFDADKDFKSKSDKQKARLIGTINYKSAKINRLYLDFDCERNPQDALYEAIITVKTLNRHGIFAHCYFSGSKGVALYLEFKTIDIQPENKKAVLSALFDLITETVSNDYENFCGMWIKSTHTGFLLELETLDHQVRGDIARVSRIPNSRHKSGFFCIPLTFGDMYRGISHIKELAKTPRCIDLENIITYTIMRNDKIIQIVKNLELEVITNRKHEADKLHREQLKRDYWNQKRNNKNDKCIVNDEDIKQAHATPLSKIISSDNRMKCPIHNGDNPTSFYIDHNKNYWYCHSCGRGGDAITYLMEKEHVDFVDAVRRLTSEPGQGAVV